jgi:hypothetical protein
MKEKRVLIAISLMILAMFFALSGISQAAPPLPGAIFTTNNTCGGVDLNIYTSKDAVYLDGGPSHEGAAGLADGYYYVKVTAPDGTLLGSSVGAANSTPVYVTNGKFFTCYQLSAIIVSTSSSFTTPGYDDTKNPGGEYKVWVSTVSTFDNDKSKTDNFKVRCEGPLCSSVQPPSISGAKFYDANTNGTWDSTEPGIQFWKILIYDGGSFTPFNTTTDGVGNYGFFVGDGTYGVCEVIPSASPIWVPTTVTSIEGIYPISTGNNFGNVCLGQGGGLTLGFWSNKNGQKILSGDTTWRALLTGLNLKNASGGNFDVSPGTFSTAYTAFRTWLLGATATNMAYMLSAQLAAMELNVLSGNVSQDALVYAPGCGDTGLNNSFITVTNLMEAANNQLGIDGYTPAGDPNRAIQECLKNALDDANNNKNFIQSAPCDVNYSGTETSCVPVAIP